MTARLAKLQAIIQSYECSCPPDTCREHGDSVTCEIARVLASRKDIDSVLGALDDTELREAIQLGMKHIMRESPADADTLETAVRYGRQQ